ncbi:hypothetical protein CTEN210_01112 [Chaetoceros tenuissimus]|uniref:Tetratricopeptide repeat protein n=1 Tax=Chaetoceros tenuissimus TaxID=426638 RepID=A0AAD3CFE7_9STRA|nr:hypothetical protein CTEN210_01112 [Chaetoceros tenuissimus]
MFHEALAKIGSFDDQTKQYKFSQMRVEIHKNIAQIYESIEFYSNAIDHLEQLSVIATEVYGPMDPLVSNNLNHLGLLYYKEHDYDSALSVFLKCLHICTSNKHDKNQLISLLYNIATVYKAMGMTKEALKIYLKILGYERQMMQEDTVKTPTDLIRTLRHIFEIYADQDEAISKQGIPYLLEAVDLCRQYKDEIDSRLGQNVFFLLGKYLTLNQQEVTEGFRYFCEGCELFGEVDLDIVYATGEDGLRIILAHLCTTENAFPLHAAAA